MEAERSSMSHIIVVIDNSLSTLEVVLLALTMRGCAMDGGRVIAETTRRDVHLSGSSNSYFLKYYNSNYYEQSLMLWQIPL